MSNNTKACNITEDEILALQQYHARQITQSGPSYDDYIDRINYLNKRLKAFKEPEITADTDALNPANQQIKSDNSAAGWGTNNG